MNSNLDWPTSELPTYVHPTIEKLLDYSYNSLIDYLRYQNEDKIKEILSDNRIKFKLIKSDEEKYDFTYMIQDHSLYTIKKYLFDNEGIEILANTSELIHKLNAILTSNDPFLKDFMFSNKAFCKLIYNKEQSYQYLYSIDSESACYFYEFIKENNYDIKVLLNLSDKSLASIIKKYPLSKEEIDQLLRNFTMYYHKEAVELLLNKPEITSINNIPYDFFQIIKDADVVIPPRLINDTHFTNKVASINSTRDYRTFINYIETQHDPSLIETKRKKYINKKILNLNYQAEMLDHYHECFIDIESFIKCNQPLNIEKIIYKHFNIFGVVELKRVISNIQMSLFNKDIDEIKNILQTESKLELINMIIDYHFEDYPSNVLINIREMLNYQKNNKVLNDNDISLYEEILNLDSYPISKIIKMHAKLLEIDVKAKFYDDYRKTKNDQLNDIKNSCLNKETILQYENKDLSNKYGIPVYYLNGENFYALVKSFHTLGKDSIVNHTFETNADLPSFSLTSHNNLHTFYDPRTNINLIFTDFKAEQIFHTYPDDSFSSYDIKHKVTNYIYKMDSKDELTKRLPYTYNEIIYRTKNIYKDDDLNNRLINPRILGVYAYDEINETQLEFAKKNNLPIILVNTKKYQNELTNTKFEGMTYDEGVYDNIDDKRRSSINR